MPRHLRPLEQRAANSSVGDGPTRVVLANDHPALRRSLRRLLDNEDDLDVVGEATDLEAAVHEVSVQRPHVLVLDLRMPNGFSAERIERLRTLSPSTEIVVTTMHSDPIFATQAHQAGAIGFVLADAADMELPEAVRRASRGVGYTSPHVTPARPRDPTVLAAPALLRRSAPHCGAAGEDRVDGRPLAR